MRFFHIIAAMVPGLLDIIIKRRIEKQMKPGETREAAFGQLEIRKVYNHGFAMNLLSGKKGMIKIGSAAAGFFLLAYEVQLMIKNDSLPAQVGGALAVGGALSNICDRFFKGYVVDYFGFKTKWHKFNNVTFNVGDICIVAGALMLVLSAGNKEG